MIWGGINDSRVDIERDCNSLGYGYKLYTTGYEIRGSLNEKINRTIVLALRMMRRHCLCLYGNHWTKNENFH